MPNRKRRYPKTVSGIRFPRWRRVGSCKLLPPPALPTRFLGLPPQHGQRLRETSLRAPFFDPSTLRGWGQYGLWGDDDLRPETVFRDDHFT